VKCFSCETYALIYQEFEPMLKMTGISIAFVLAIIIVNALYIQRIKNKDINIRNLLIISSLISCLFIIIGFIIDSHLGIDPLENLFVPLLAELAGIFVGFILAYEIFDKNKDRIREQLWEQQWSSIRKSAYESTLTDLIMLAIGVYSSLPGASWTEVPGDFSATRDANNDIWNKIDKELKIFPDIAKKIMGFNDREVVIKEGADNEWIEVNGENSDGGLVIDEEAILNLIKKSHKNIKPYLDDIKNIQISRIIDSSRDKEIKKDIADFERDLNNYYYNMQRFFDNRFGGHSHGYFAIKSMITLCEKGSNLYARLKEK